MRRALRACFWVRAPFPSAPVPGAFTHPLTHPLYASYPSLSLTYHADSRDQVLGRAQMWRHVTSLLPFEGLAEALLGVLLLYRQGRSMERLLGSSKYSLFVLLASVAAVGCRLGLISSLPSPGLHAPLGGGAPHSWIRTGLASGPYHVIFGLLPLYYRYIPCRTSVYFKLGPVAFSDKAQTYAMHAALAACTGPRSLLAAVYSLLFGLLYALPGAGKGLQSIPVPRAVREWVGAIVLPLLGEGQGPITSSAGAGQGRRRSTGAGGAGEEEEEYEGEGAWYPAAPGGAGVGGQGSGGALGRAAAIRAASAAGGAGAQDAPVGQGPEPDEAAVERVCGMGFERPAVVAALRAAWGDEQAAVNRLLSG